METSVQYLETSAQYREFAEECNRLAKQVKTDGERKILEEMAEAWRIVAAEEDNKRAAADCRRVRDAASTTISPHISIRKSPTTRWPR
jgi:hypothetical protein